MNDIYCDVCGHWLLSAASGPTCSQCTSWAFTQSSILDRKTWRTRRIEARSAFAEKYLHAFDDFELELDKVFFDTGLQLLVDMYYKTQPSAITWSEKAAAGDVWTLITEKREPKYDLKRFTQAVSAVRNHVAALVNKNG